MRRNKYKKLKDINNIKNKKTAKEKFKFSNKNKKEDTFLKEELLSSNINPNNNIKPIKNNTINSQQNNNFDDEEILGSGEDSFSVPLKDVLDYKSSPTTINNSTNNINSTSNNRFIFQQNNNFDDEEILGSEENYFLASPEDVIDYEQNPNFVQHNTTEEKFNVIFNNYKQLHSKKIENFYNELSILVNKNNVIDMNKMLSNFFTKNNITNLLEQCAFIEGLSGKLETNQNNQLQLVAETLYNSYTNTLETTINKIKTSENEQKLYGSYINSFQNKLNDRNFEILNASLQLLKNSTSKMDKDVGKHCERTLKCFFELEKNNYFKQKNIDASKIYTSVMEEALKIQDKYNPIYDLIHVVQKLNKKNNANHQISNELLVRFLNIYKQSNELTKLEENFLKGYNDNSANFAEILKYRNQILLNIENSIDMGDYSKLRKEPKDNLLKHSSSTIDLSEIFKYEEGFTISNTKENSSNIDNLANTSLEWDDFETNIERNSMEFDNSERNSMEFDNSERNIMENDIEWGEFQSADNSQEWGNQGWDDVKETKSIKKTKASYPKKNYSIKKDAQYESETARLLDNENTDKFDNEKPKSLKPIKLEDFYTDKIQYSKIEDKNQNELENKTLFNLFNKISGSNPLNREFGRNKGFKSLILGVKTGTFKEWDKSKDKEEYINNFVTFLKNNPKLTKDWIKKFKPEEMRILSSSETFKKYLRSHAGIVEEVKENNQGFGNNPERTITKKDKTQTKEPKQTESSKIKDKSFENDPKKLEKAMLSKLSKEFREMQNEKKMLGLKTIILDEDLSVDNKVITYLKIDGVLNNSTLTNKFKNIVLKLEINKDKDIKKIITEIRKKGFSYLEKQNIGSYSIVDPSCTTSTSSKVNESLNASKLENINFEELNDEFNKCFGKKINEKSK